MESLLKRKSRIVLQQGNVSTGKKWEKKGGGGRGGSVVVVVGGGDGGEEEGRRKTANLEVYSRNKQNINIEGSSPHAPILLAQTDLNKRA